MDTPDTTTNLTGLRVFISYPRGGLAQTRAKLVQQDLEARGAFAWRDETTIEEGDQNWLERIEEGLARCDILAYLLTDEQEDSVWVERELLTAQEQYKPILVLRLEPVTLPHLVKEKQPVEHRGAQADTLQRLAEALFREWRNSLNISSTEHLKQGVPEILDSLQRRWELEWLDEIIHVDYSDRDDRYVSLSAEEQRCRSLERAMKSVRMDMDVLLEAFGQHETPSSKIVQKTFSDVLLAYRELKTRKVRRLAVLGDPGAGKTFSLERIALEYAETARKDPAAPIPLLVQLGRWTRDGQSLVRFIETTLGDLGRHFAKLREQGRAILLLDAMNEIPPGQRRHKTEQIQHLVQDDRFSSLLVSCRARDFESDFRLPFDTLTLQPLSPSKIREFLQRVLGLHLSRDATTEADVRFWQIAGGDEIQQAWLAWEQAGGCFDSFLADTEAPKTFVENWWHSRVRGRLQADKRNLIHLASNPYLLQIMAILPELSANRAQLFRGFLQVLYQREQKAREKRQDAASVPEQGYWLAVLGELAQAMQFAGGAQSDSGAQTVLPRSAWPTTLTQTLLDFSRDASVLQLTGDDLRFTHQLLQEYLASRVLLVASQTDSGTASHYWPADNWWQRSGWEVVAEIAAESLAADGIESYIAWLARDNPALAAEIWQAQDRPNLSHATRRTIHAQWFDLMTNIQQVPQPRARAAIGTALGRFGLDDRPGIGLDDQGLPAIEWVEIPAGPFLYGKDKQQVQLERYYISRYPITNAQYQAFVEAGGYQDERWWRDLQRPQPQRSTWDPDNRPRTDVDWYEAVAFTRWLSAQLNKPIRLPTEQEWEKAARGTDGREYPWGDKYINGYANVQERGDAGEYLGETSAVGLYPQGASLYGVLDLAGNVDEWCMNKYDHPQQIEPDTSGASRVLRGGSWFYSPDGARAADRDRYLPDDRDYVLGFRVVLSASIF